MRTRLKALPKPWQRFKGCQEATHGAQRTAERFCRARMHEKLASVRGVHVTKVHVYGGTASGMMFVDFMTGTAHGMAYGVGVLVLAVVDMLDKMGD